MSKRLNFKTIARRTLRSWSFWSLALIFVGVCAYQFENWRGHRAWKHYVQAAKAKGLHLEWEECIPPQVPDNENFAMTPVLAQIYGVATSASSVPGGNLQACLAQIDQNKLETDCGSWIRGEHFSLATCLASNIRADSTEITPDLARRFGASPSDKSFVIKEKNAKLKELYSQMSPSEQAAAILEALAPIEPVILELRAAMKRPACRYPFLYKQVDWNASLPSHLGPLRDFGQWLRIWAICQLELGRTDDALNAIELGLYLGNSVTLEPWNYSRHVRYLLNYWMNQPIWEGVARHLWTDSQLARIQALRPMTNLVAEAAFRLPRFRTIDIHRAETEWNAGIAFDWGRIEGKSWVSISEYLADIFYFNWGPDGWLSMEKVNLCRRYDDFYEQVFDFCSGRIRLPEIAAWENFLSSPKSHHPYVYHIHFATSYGVSSGFALRLATQQTSADFAYLGCALERYWLAKGTYPQRMEDLVPEYASKVPQDILTGEPYHYRWDDKDHYLLYSVGFDGIDNGGTVPKVKPGQKVESDWLWRGGTPATPLP